MSASSSFGAGFPASGEIRSAVCVGPLAIIFGVIGISRANRLGGAGKGMAITGLVCGIIAVAVAVLFIAAVYVRVHSVSG